MVADVSLSRVRLCLTKISDRPVITVNLSVMTGELEMSLSKSMNTCGKISASIYDCDRVIGDEDAEGLGLRVWGRWGGGVGIKGGGRRGDVRSSKIGVCFGVGISDLVGVFCNVCDVKVLGDVIRFGDERVSSVLSDFLGVWGGGVFFTGVCIVGSVWLTKFGEVGIFEHVGVVRTSSDVTSFGDVIIFGEGRVSINFGDGWGGRGGVALTGGRGSLDVVG